VCVRARKCESSDVDCVCEAVNYCASLLCLCVCALWVLCVRVLGYICVYACMSAVLCALCDFVCFVLRRRVGAVCVRATECGMRAGWSEKGKGLSQFKL
jgi:hypothetical protein